MHWWTWGDDDALYFADDDGSNFGLPWNFAHLMRATGIPPDHRVEEVSAFPELIRPETIRYRRYVDGAVAVGSRLFVAAYDYDDSAPDVEFRLINWISPHGGICSLMYSDDYGKTWQNAPEPDEERMDYFLGPNFAGLAFVGFGPGYTGVPERFGDHVYAISNDDNWETGSNIFLARVPRDRVLDRSAWEFFERLVDGEPVWSPDEGAAGPVLTDPWRIGHPTMTWNAGLDRFLLTYSTDAVPHKLDTPFEEAQATWDRTSELLVLEAPAPWGPWGLVHHDPAWEHPHMPYLPQVPSKWLSPDGLSGWMVYSGDYWNADDDGSYYGFMTRPFRLLPSDA